MCLHSFNFHIVVFFLHPSVASVFHSFSQTDIESSLPPE